MFHVKHSAIYRNVYFSRQKLICLVDDNNLYLLILANVADTFHSSRRIGIRQSRHHKTGQVVHEAEKQGRYPATSQGQGADDSFIANTSGFSHQVVEIPFDSFSSGKIKHYRLIQSACAPRRRILRQER